MKKSFEEWKAHYAFLNLFNIKVESTHDILRQVYSKGHSGIGYQYADDFRAYTSDRITFNSFVDLINDAVELDLDASIEALESLTPLSAEQLIFIDTDPRMIEYIKSVV